MTKFLTTHSKVFLLGALASLAVTFNACTDVDTTLGDDLLQGGDNVLIETLSIDPSTVITKKFPTTLSGNCYLGIYKDPVFGEISSSLVTMIAPTSSTQYADTLHDLVDVLDINLTLKLKGGVGDSLAKQNLKVFQLKEILKADSVYYSDYKIEEKIESNPISKKKDDGKSEYEYDRKGDGIVTVPLEESFANALLNRGTLVRFHKAVKADSKTSLHQQFINEFKGLFIENTSTTSAVGGLNAINFADTSTRVLVRYILKGSKGQDSSVRMSLKIGLLQNSYGVNLLNRFNVVKHNYNTDLKPISDNSNIIVNTNGNPDYKDLVYLQGFGGLRTQLKFNSSTVEKFAEKGYKIHRAELVVEPYFPNGILNYNRMPMSISAYYSKTISGTEKMLFVPDMETFKGVSTNAYYNRSRRLYSLNITTFFKDAMRGVKPNEFYLYAGVPAGLYNSQSSSYGTNYAELPSDFLSQPNQVMLRGDIKLVITYSK